MRIIVSLALALSLAACSGQEQKDDNNTPEVEEQQDVEMVIARVPVDENGEEMTDQIEMSVVAGEQDFDSETSAAGAFAAGEKVGMTDELDEDSSTDSWNRRGYKRHGHWQSNSYSGNWLGRGTWWGKNPHLNRGRCGYGGYSGSNCYSQYHYRARYQYPRYRYYTWCNNTRYRNGFNRRSGY
jgi:hypothetical protein